MPDYLDSEFAAPAGAEAPLVIGYIVALTLFALAWSNLSAPTVGRTELRSAARAQAQKHETAFKKDQILLAGRYSKRPGSDRPYGA